MATQRKLGPFLRVKTVDVRDLNADITISCSDDPDTEVLVKGTFFRTGKVHAHRSVDDRGSRLRLANRNDSIKPVNRHLEFVVKPGQQFLHSSQTPSVRVELSVLEGTRVLY